MRWPGIILILLFLFSCNSREKQERIEQIDIISHRLNSMADVFLKIDSVKVRQNFTTVKQNLGELNKLSLNRSNKLIKDYGKLKKEFKNYLKTRPFIIDELGFTRNQLSDLKHDVKYNKLSDQEFELYLKHEANAAQRLRVKMSHFNDRLQNQMKIFDSLNPVFIEFIDSCRLVSE